MLKNQPYYSLSNHFKEFFGEKVYKVSLEGGFTCPNRDGFLAFGGCTFCSQDGSLSPGVDPLVSIPEQIRKGQNFLSHRYGAKKFVAYFQSFTNTYAPVSELKQKYELALEQPNIVGISISTRPDCVPNETLDIIADISEKHYTWLELGLQTIHDETNKFLNRWHSFADFEDAVQRAAQRNLRVCAHVILYLPGENITHMTQTIQTLAQMPIHGIKIHLLHVIKKTALAQQYIQGLITLPTQDEYVQTVCNFLEILPPSLIIHRLTGETSADEMIAPLWALQKASVIRGIQAELERRQSYQGKNFNP
ncbi:MAG: TIGR01212 family radical SAM protein [Deltaproteobacteria bacterium]|nr:TIGR01212 family radical SAM protein [Deltaproteobacteria bacterium]